MVWVNKKRAFSDAAMIRRHVIGTVYLFRRGEKSPSARIRCVLWYENRTQSNHATLLSSRYMSSQPMSESGIDRIWETRTQKWIKCNVPPMRQADVFGAGSGTLLGKIDTSKAIRDGKEVILALKVS